MSRKWNMVFYVLMLGVFGFAIYEVMQRGRSQENVGRTVAQANTDKGSLQLFTESFSGNIGHPLPTLLLQIMIIVIVVRLFGYLFNKIGQPVVVGEIVAGIVQRQVFQGLSSWAREDHAATRF